MGGQPYFRHPAGSTHGPFQRVRLARYDLVGIEWRGPVPQSNYTLGREGGPVELIVDHWTVVMFEGPVRRFKEPASRLGPAMAPPDALYAASAQLHREIATRYGLALVISNMALPHRAIVPTECPGTDLDRIVRETTEEDDMFSEEDRRKLVRVYQDLEAYEPLFWTTRLQRRLAKAIRSVFPNADVSGPGVETGQPFKG